MPGETYTRPVATAEGLAATARRYLELGADLVGVLIPLESGEVAEVVLGYRFDGGTVIDPNVPLEDALRCAGVAQEAYDESVAFAGADWGRDSVRLFAARKVREDGALPWHPDVSYPPEPVPNVDLSR